MDADPVALIEQLDPEAIASRLDKLQHERQALLVLLRAARARSGPRGPRTESGAEVTRPADEPVR